MVNPENLGLMKGLIFLAFMCVSVALSLAMGTREENEYEEENNEYRFNIDEDSEVIIDKDNECTSIRICSNRGKN